MTVTRAAFGLAGIALMLMSTRVSAPHLMAAAARGGILNASASLPWPDDAVVLGMPNPLDDDEGRLDLNGNDVTDAVATYRLGADGALYEAHSPQTELPTLAPPKS